MELRSTLLTCAVLRIFGESSTAWEFFALSCDCHSDDPYLVLEKYAFADLVVGTLYHNFVASPDGFEDRLINLLSAGATLDFETALQPFGLDPTSPSFWEDALKAHLGGLIDEAEMIAKGLGYSTSS